MVEPPGPATDYAERGRKPADFHLLKHNLGMAVALEEFLASAFGPGGRAKLYLDSKGQMVPTTDGARMLSMLDSPHPVAKIIAAAAKSQAEEWEDGTKLTALLALRLLHRADSLLEKGLRPPRIVAGYEIGLALATEAAMSDAIEMDPMYPDLLRGVARASIGEWLEGRPRETLAEAVVATVCQVATRSTNGEWHCDRRDIHIFAKAGGSFSVEAIDGYVIERSRDDDTMPMRVEDARIALFDAAPIRGKAGIHEPRLRWLGDSKILLKSPAELEKYADVNEQFTADMVGGLRREGANVVLCTLGISDYGHKLLAKAGILGIRRIMKTRYMEAVALATGASLIKDFREVRSEQLGHAGLVEERRIGHSKSLVISQCSNPRVVSLLILGPGVAAAEHYAAQARKAIAAVAAVFERPRLVIGGSGAELSASRHVRKKAFEVSGREQLAVEAFAAALEDLARCLATNLGLNPVDTLVDLRRRHTASPSWGLLAGNPGPVDLAHGALLEPLTPRLAAWRRAVEACNSLLQVDDFHKAARRHKDGQETRADSEKPTER